MASNRDPPAFTSHHSDSVTSLLNAALGKLREALELIDQSCDQVAGAHVQAAIDGITILLAQRAHGRAVLITDFLPQRSSIPPWRAVLPRLSKNRFVNMT